MKEHSISRHCMKSPVLFNNTSMIPLYTSVRRLRLSSVLMSTNMADSTIALARLYYRVLVALAVLSTVAVLLRMVARWRSKVLLAVDDILIGVSWLLMLGSVINSSYSMCRAVFKVLES